MLELFLIIIVISALAYAKNTRNQLDAFREDIKKALKKKDFKKALLEILEPSHPTTPPIFPGQENLKEQPRITKSTTQTKAMPISPKKGKSMGSLEENFARRASVWLGGIALAIGGVFLVKQSIEAGLLTPEVRIIF